MPKAKLPRLYPLSHAQIVFGMEVNPIRAPHRTWNQAETLPLMGQKISGTLSRFGDVD
jgi:hypothetical protein